MSLRTKLILQCLCNGANSLVCSFSMLLGSEKNGFLKRVNEILLFIRGLWGLENYWISFAALSRTHLRSFVVKYVPNSNDKLFSF